MGQCDVTQKLEALEKIKNGSLDRVKKKNVSLNRNIFG